MTTALHFAEDGWATRSRQALLRYRERQFQKLLHYAWNRSDFYREYYANQGIRENDLAGISINDLPLLPKKT
jgi:phenylacetate-coenzyme A ligase PaaK-like adenylate-forming protein